MSKQQCVARAIQYILLIFNHTCQINYLFDCLSEGRALNMPGRTIVYADSMIAIF